MDYYRGGGGGGVEDSLRMFKRYNSEHVSFSRLNTLNNIIFSCTEIRQTNEWTNEIRWPPTYSAQFTSQWNDKISDQYFSRSRNICRFLIVVANNCNLKNKGKRKTSSLPFWKGIEYIRN